MAESILISEPDKLNKDGVIAHLKEIFGNVIDTCVIEYIAWENNYNVERSSVALLDRLESKDNRNYIDQCNFTDTNVSKPENFDFRAAVCSNYPIKNTTKCNLNVTSTNKVKSKKEKNVDRVISLIQQGYKMLILLRGLPGSGKSHLARTILDNIGLGVNYSQHILSTDDFFLNKRGVYEYDVRKLNEAHAWNQSRALKSMAKAVTPILIDNTNCESWEMKPYALYASQYGYCIEIVEPYTNWAFNITELSRKNIHNVPKKKLEQMILRYEKNITIEKLLSAFAIKYSKPIVIAHKENDLNEKNKCRIQLDEQLEQFYNSLEESNLENSGATDEVTSFKDTQVHSYIEKVDDDVIMEWKRKLEKNSNASPFNNEDVKTNFRVNVGDNNEIGNKTENQTDWGANGEILLSWDTPVSENINRLLNTKKDAILESNTKPVMVDKEVSTLDDTYIKVITPRSFFIAGSRITNENNNLKCINQSTMTDEFEMNQEVNEQFEQLLKYFPSLQVDELKELFISCLYNMDETIKLIFNRAHHSTTCDNSNHAANYVENIIDKTDSTSCTQNIIGPEIPSTSVASEGTLIDISNDATDNILLKNCSGLDTWGLNFDAFMCWDVASIASSSKTVFESELGNNDYSKTKKMEVKHTSTQTESCDIYGKDMKSKILIPNKFFTPGTVVIDPKPKSKLMLEKGTMTDELNQSSSSCNSEDTKFNELTSLFPTIPSDILRDVFEKCNYDTDWAAELLLDDKKEILPLPPTSREASKIEQTELIVVNEPKEVVTAYKVKSGNPFTLIYDSKNPIETPEDIKKSIEKKIKLSDDCYSGHILKLKKQKEELHSPLSSKFIINNAILDDCDAKSDCSDSSQDNDELVEINVGDTFIAQLEDKIGASNMDYPRGFQPIIQMPVSLAKQLHAYYLHSVYIQLEAQNQIIDKMVKEDEDLASKLQIQEYANNNSDNESGNSDLKSIMLEQAFLSQKKKESEKWKDMARDDLAFRLTQQKLFNEFPHLDKNTLLEILHAHNNSYIETINVITASQPNSSTNENLSIVHKASISSETIKEMNEDKILCDKFSPEPDYSASEYRRQADKILELRKQLHMKAQNYYQNGMPDVALFYSNLAKEQTKRYNYANTVAAQAFLTEQKKDVNNLPTIDLHFLRIKEAITSLDIFLDFHIEKLKHSSGNTSSLNIITGKGNRSLDGKSKIRPAVMARLDKRKIKYTFLNPGMLKVDIFKSTKVTDEV